MTTATQNTRVKFAKELNEDNARACVNLERHLGEIAKDLRCVIERMDAAHGWLAGTLHTWEGDPETTAAENAKVAAKIYSDYLAAKDTLDVIEHQRKKVNQMIIYINAENAELNGVEL